MKRLKLFIAAVFVSNIFVPQATSAKVVNRTIATVNGKSILLSEFNKNYASFIQQQNQLLPPEQMTDQWKSETKQKILEQMIDDKVLLLEAKKQKVRVNRRELENGIYQVKARFLPLEGRRDLQNIVQQQVAAQQQPNQGDRTRPEIDLPAAWSELKKKNPAAVKEAKLNFQTELDTEGITKKKFEARIRDQLSVVQLSSQAMRERATPPSDEKSKILFNQLLLVMQGKKVKNITEKESSDLESMSKFFAAQTGERVQARHILIQLPPDASFKEKSAISRKVKDIRKKILAGSDFAEMAAKFSADKASAARGGDLGMFTRGQMVPPFEKAAFSLKVGEVSEIVRSEFGYHIIKVEGKRAASKLRFEDIQNDLKEYLYQAQAQKVFEKYVKELRKKAAIKINIDLKELAKN